MRQIAPAGQAQAGADGHGHAAQAAGEGGVGGVEIAVGVEPDQAEARGRPVGLLQAAEDAHGVGAVAAGEEEGAAGAAGLRHSLGDGPAEPADVGDLVVAALLLGEGRLDHGVGHAGRAVGAGGRVGVQGALVAHGRPATDVAHGDHVQAGKRLSTRPAHRPDTVPRPATRAGR